MEAFTLFVGVIGNIISILMFLSPAETFWRIIKQRSTEEFESLPYICTLLSSCLWTYYGITKPNSLLIATVNGFGMVVETFYVSSFLLFAPPHMRAKTAILTVVLNVWFLVIAILVTRLALEGELRIDAIGLLCAILNVVMYGSPLSAMKRVITSKSVEYMPFMLSLFLLLNGGIWTLYALLVRDVFLGVPNGIGFVLGTIQLVIYAIYRRPKPLTNVTSVGTLEEGSQRESLITYSESTVTPN